MIILGTNSIKDTGGFSVDNSCRFNYADSPYLEKTNSSSTATNIDKYTLSFWVKRSSLTAYGDGNGGNIIASNTAAYVQLYFKDNDTLRWQEHDGSDSVGNLITNRVFRDVSAWVHIVCLYDSGNGTAGDRMQIWINGVRETSFGTEAQPTQNANGQFGTASQARRIANNSDGSRDFDGYIAEAVGLDGVCASPVDTLGEFDEDSGIWKPKKVSGLTFGTHGFYLDFKDSANLGNDANSGTDFGETNVATTDQTTDTPTNNFATMNFLVPSQGGFTPGSPTFAEGNLKFTTANSSGSYSRTNSTFLLTAGKWYTEIKYTNSGTIYGLIGVTGSNATTTAAYPGVYAYDYAWYGNGSGGNFYNNNGIAAYLGAGYANNDILGMAIDLDSGTKTIQYYKNGSAVSSAQTIVDPATTDFGGYCITIGEWSSSTNATFEVNFGNPSFSISSSNADGDGYGNMEYAVPSGYYVLNSKNLAEYG